MIVKQPVSINFSQGLDTKTDPYQVSIGKFLSLVNSVFTKGGLLQKRNGYGPLASLPTAGSVYLTTLNGNMTALGNAIQAYSEPNESWVNKGTFQPITLSVLPTARSALNQTQCDSVVAGNGFICTVYTEVNNATVSYKYVVADSSTGQNIVLPTVITVGSGTVTGSPRVFLLGNYFIIAFTNNISGTFHLQYIAVSTLNPKISTTNADLAAAYTPSNSLSWDGIVLDNNLYFAYYLSGTGVEINFISNALVVNTTLSLPVFAGVAATHMSMCTDTTNPANPAIYASFYNSGNSEGFVVAVNATLQKLMTSTEIIASKTVYNITCAAQNGLVTTLYEVAAQYSYDDVLETNFIQETPVTLPATTTTGTVGTTTTVLMSVGLASKAFIINGVIYALSEYASELQSTYFLTDVTGNIISRFAYENGGASLITTAGYLPVGLPQAQAIGSNVYIAYLYKDVIDSQNTLGLNPTIGPAGASNIYSQTGVNLITIGFNSSTLGSSEIGANLNITGGLLWAYDGQTLSEQNFNVFPDNIETLYTEVSTVTPTGTFLIGSFTITVSSNSGVSVGMTISDTTNSTYIPAGTIITNVSGTTLTISQATTHAGTGDTLSIQGNIPAKPDGSTNTNAYWYRVIYEWTDAAGNIFRGAPSVPVSVTTAGSGSTGTITVFVPTLRLSYKKNVKIIIYRWSVANQIYYQITSLTSPLLNNPSVNSVLFTDTVPDADIVGNSIIYTTGGVIEDVGGPAAVASTLFDDRLWLIDAEDRNLLWYSKQVIEGTPVEMSDLLTLYVAPSTGAQGSTGPMTAVFPMDDKLIIFKPDAIYYINGTGPDNTGSNSTYSQPIFITSTVGCSNQNSIVIMTNGLMFQSDKGIWLLGRDLSTEYIGAPVEAFNSYTVNSAIAIPGTNQVRFTLQNNTILMYDYYYQQWATFTGVSSLSSTLYQDLHTCLSPTGAILQENPGVYLDNDSPVLLSFLTSWIAVAGLQGYQRAYWFFLLGTYYTPHKLNCQISYNYNPSPTQSTLVKPVNAAPIYGSTAMPVYGQLSPYGGPSNVEDARVFLNQQRCTSFQLSIQEVYDPSFGIPAGQGLSLSGVNLVVAVKKGWRTQASTTSYGTPTGNQ